MKTALVLSAGGMFGAYQAGAWKELADQFKPDLVVGTSAGAMNGWAIAAGVPADDLIAAWLDPSTSGTMRARVPWLPWRGVFDPEPLRLRARELVERYRPRIPFFGTVVEIPSLRVRIVSGERMSWQHLVAMCSVPLGYPPVRLEHGWSVDGGLLSVLPIWAAAELGAQRVVAINCLPLMPSRAIRAAAGLVRRLAREKSVPPDVEILHISPGQPLGTVRQACTWNADRLRAWIERGREDARQAWTRSMGINLV